MADRPYIIETIRVGNQFKVTACDPESGVEASIIAPINLTRKEMSDMAVKKLEYVLRRDADKKDA